MLKQDLIFKIMNQTENQLQKKTEEVIGLMKDELGTKIIK